MSERSQDARAQREIINSLRTTPEGRELLKDFRANNPLMKRNDALAELSSRIHEQRSDTSMRDALVMAGRDSMSAKDRVGSKSLDYGSPKPETRVEHKSSGTGDATTSGEDEEEEEPPTVYTMWICENGFAITKNFYVEPPVLELE